MNWFKTKNIDLTDQELLLKIKQDGASKWIVALYSRYIEMIYGTCLKYHKDGEKSKDATMDIYEKFEKKVRTHQVDNLKSWLYVMVKNHCLETLRKDKRTREKFNAYSDVQNDSFYHPYNEEENDHEKKFNDLEDCMSQLNENQKKCIDLFYLQKKSYAYISEAMKLEWNKVRSLIQNGRRNLKNCLEAK